ncbi:hypothetical protein [Streptomyces sp. NPDC002588]|uniref:hypothetical protein n=1 Tax=Streptomyces sp. NPDC002588 TaxID=3154419 RepID=UPI00331EF8C7
MRRLRGGAAVAVALMCAVTATGCKEQTTGSGAAGTEPTTGGAASGGAALTAAESLTVKGRAPKKGYERDKFGTAWADTDSNNCDTRVISMLRRVIEVFAQFTQGVVGCAC